LDPNLILINLAIDINISIKGNVGHENYFRILKSIIKRKKSD